MVGIEPATAGSRVRRANHCATLPLKRDTGEAPRQRKRGGGGEKQIHRKTERYTVREWDTEREREKEREREREREREVEGDIMPADR